MLKREKEGNESLKETLSRYTYNKLQLMLDEWKIFPPFLDVYQRIS